MESSRCSSACSFTRLCTNRVAWFGSSPAAKKVAVSSRVAGQISSTDSYFEVRACQSAIM